MGPWFESYVFQAYFLTLSKRKWLNMWNLHDRCVLPCCPVSVPDYELSKCIHLNPNSSDSIQNMTAVKLKHKMWWLKREKTHFFFPREKQIWHAITYRICALRFFSKNICRWKVQFLFMSKLPFRQFSSLVAVLETPSLAAIFCVGNRHVSATLEICLKEWDVHNFVKIIF